MRAAWRLPVWVRARQAARLRDLLAGHLACHAVLKRRESLCAGYEDVGPKASGYGSVTDVCRTWYSALQDSLAEARDKDKPRADNGGAGCLESHDCAYRIPVFLAILRRAPDLCPEPAQDACKALLKSGGETTCEASANEVNRTYCSFCAMGGPDIPCLR
ncbi:MAG: hypothetical protein PHF00_05110 [Elusimicrobia bacterium]|nr:hypothetical protein [Elusimicrobiota bacterium]